MSVELRTYLRVLQRRWPTILVCALLGLLASGAYLLLTTPTYQASTRLFVSTNTGTSAYDLNQAGAFTQSIVKSYAEVASAPIVLDPVIRKLDLPYTSTELAADVDVSAPADTVVLLITVTDPSPSRAAAIADSIATEMTTVADQLLPSSSKSTGPTVRLAVIQRATVPTSASSPQLWRELALGLAAGLLVGFAIGVLRQISDTRIHRAAELAQVSDAPVLGTIPFSSDLGKQPVLAGNTRGPVAESFRALRTSLEFLDVGESAHAFVVTSSIEGEGKSTTVVNLGVVAAGTGRRVLIVDADMRRPKIADYLGLNGSVGLSDVLVGRAGLNNVVQAWGHEQLLEVLPAGTVPPNPSELLQSDRMRSLLSELQQTYDLILLDAPPLLPVTDATILARRASGAILVVAAQKTSLAQVRTAVESLHRVDARLFGMVVTQAPTKGPDAYGSAYHAYGTAGGTATAAG